MAISRELSAYAILILFLAAVVSSHDGPAGGEASLVQPKPGGPSTGRAKVFNVLDFGIKCGPNTDNAQNLLKVWRAACDYNGEARILFPKGEFYASGAVFEGPCKAPIGIEIHGNIMAVSDMKIYREDAWLTFEKVIGMYILGNGVIDGRGANLWKFKDREGKLSLPMSLKFTGCEKLTISGITSLNPMGCHISIFCCTDFTATNLRLVAPDQSPHTDGFHISRSTNVKILDTFVGTGDDCVGIIHGCVNVLVRGMTCGPGHGLSIGSIGKSPGELPVKNILFENCKINGADNGVRIKTHAQSFPTVIQNVTFRNIQMTNVSHPIIIDQLYGEKCPEGSKVQITNAQFINIKGTTRSENGVDLRCSSAAPCQGIKLSNIDLQYIGRKDLTFASNCTNAKITYDGFQSPAPCC